VDGTGSGLYPVVGFGNSSVQTLSFVTRELISKTVPTETGSD
jgi:hypothetical protein